MASSDILATDGVLEAARPEIEARVRAAFDSGDFETAATLVVRCYGGELLSFILCRLQNAVDASEVFSDFAEDLWRGLPGFKWRTSVRSWAYTLARNAAIRYQTSPQRRPERNLALPQSSRVNMAVQELRTTTQLYLRTEVKSKMRELRERLPEDDQTLLVLRIDREMSWKELAAIMSGQGEALYGDEVTRWAARLRKRFQAIKDRLREMARAEGIL